MIRLQRALVRPRPARPEIQARVSREFPEQTHDEAAEPPQPERRHPDPSARLAVARDRLEQRRPRLAARPNHVSNPSHVLRYVRLRELERETERGDDFEHGIHDVAKPRGVHVPGARELDVGVERVERVDDARHARRHAAARRALPREAALLDARHVRDDDVERRARPGAARDDDGEALDARARASAEDETFEMPDVDFIGTILQDVRKGQKGFATRMSVHEDARADAIEGFPVTGDIVKIQFGVETGEGEVLQDAAATEAVTFEVGASDVMGNPLFKAFDEAVRKLNVGNSAVVSASGGDYDPNLLFSVPANHEEIARLRAEWSDKGGLVEGLTVTLVNGQPAVVRAMDAEKVVLDANHPFAGADVFFKVTLLGVNVDEA